MDKKELIDRLENVQLKLEAEVGEKYQELKAVVADVEKFGSDAYREALDAYNSALAELDGFLKTAKAQKNAIRAWIVSNKVMLAVNGACFLAGMIVARILISIG
jgi:hypothetical protein